MTIYSFINNKIHSTSHRIKQAFIDPCIRKAKTAYLKFGPSVVFALMTAACGVSALSSVHALSQDHEQEDSLTDQCIIYPILGISMIASTYISFKAAIKTKECIQEEIAIRKNNQALKALEENYNQAAPLGAPFVAALYCESDENTAFRLTNPYSIPLEALSPLKGMCQVAFLPITGPHEIQYKLEQIAKKQPIDHLLICGHGNSKEVVFRSDSLLFSKLGHLKEQDFTTEMFRSISKTIAFIACETGKIKGIASRLSKYTPQTIYAPPKPLSIDLLWIVPTSDGLLAPIFINEDFALLAFAFKNNSILDFDDSNNIFKEFDFTSLKETAIRIQSKALLYLAALNFLDKKDPKSALTCLEKGSQYSPAPRLKLPLNLAEEHIRAVCSHKFNLQIS